MPFNINYCNFTATDMHTGLCIRRSHSHILLSSLFRPNFQTLPLFYEDTEDTVGELRLNPSNRSASLLMSEAVLFTDTLAGLHFLLAFVGRTRNFFFLEDIARPLNASAATWSSSRPLFSPVIGLPDFVKTWSIDSDEEEDPDLRFLVPTGPRARIRFRVEFQRFLMALSVRPMSRLAISAQRFPNSS